MATAPSHLAESEILPRYIFLEPLLSKARVLEIGAVAATGGRGARMLLDRGASPVVALDENPAAVARAASDPDVAAEGIEFRAGDWRELGDGTFDLVILHDCSGLIADPKLLDVL